MTRKKYSPAAVILLAAGTASAVGLRADRERAYTGDTVSVTVQSTSTARVTVTWATLGKEWKRETKTIPAGSAVARFSIAAPRGVKKPTPLFARARGTVPGEPTETAETVITLFPPGGSYDFSAAHLPRRRVVLCDPAGETAREITRLGLPFTTVPDVDKLEGVAWDLLILGPGVIPLDRPWPMAIGEVVRKGRRVLVLDATGAVPTPTRTMDLVSLSSITWGADVLPTEIPPPTRWDGHAAPLQNQNAVSLADVPQGSLLLSVPSGEGRFLLNRFPLSGLYSRDPFARWLLAFSLKFLLADAKKT